MATRTHLATGVGAATVGVTAGELVLHARERDMVTERQAQLLTLGSGGTALGIGGLGAVGIGVGPMAAAGLAGYGVGSIAWVAARDRGLAPKLTVEVPERVNLAGPVVTTVALSTVGVALSTLTSAVR